MTEPFRILSLGAGVQSSALALMWAAGATPGGHPAPEAAVFADTGSEPRAVYDWLAWLTLQVPFPVHTVTAGNLGTDVLSAWRGERSHVGNPPFFVRGRPGENLAMLWRKCTQEYKLRPIRRWVAANRQRRPVVQYIGISLDEAIRMKPSGVKYISNTFPLIDGRLTRHACLTWLERHGFPTPPRSACTFCPYRSNLQFRLLRDTAPHDWADLVAFDAALRQTPPSLNGAKVLSTAYVHRSGRPLPLAPIDDDDPNQGDLFGDECEGMCGV